MPLRRWRTTSSEFRPTELLGCDHLIPPGVRGLANSRTRSRGRYGPEDRRDGMPLLEVASACRCWPRAVEFGKSDGGTCARCCVLIQSPDPALRLHVAGRNWSKRHCRMAVQRYRPGRPFLFHPLMRCLQRRRTWSVTEIDGRFCRNSLSTMLSEPFIPRKGQKV